MRRKYQLRFLFRLATLAGVAWLYLRRRALFAVVEGAGFCSALTILHFLWLVWMLDMLAQLLPSRGLMALGSQKQFAVYFRPDAQETAVPRAWIRKNNRAAAAVFLGWAAVTAVLGLLKRRGVLDGGALLVVCTFFYVCDLICVLWWCPFRALVLKNRCCTTCRIFNWDHLMMFSPLVFVRGFYAASLIVFAAVVFAVWEIRFHRHPDRFYEGSNVGLRCANCTDHLCGRKTLPARTSLPT